MTKISKMQIDDSYFLREGVVDIDAGVVGIGRSRWRSVKDSAGESSARSIMGKNRFDVLPIENKDGSIHEYFSPAHGATSLRSGSPGSLIGTYCPFRLTFAIF
jgi:hypothetical protein